MSTSDLSAVAARRAEIVRFVGDYDAKVAALHTELEELAVTERVLHRLERLMPEEPRNTPPNMPTSRSRSARSAR